MFSQTEFHIELRSSSVGGAEWNLRELREIAVCHITILYFAVLLPAFASLRDCKLLRIIVLFVRIADISCIGISLSGIAERRWSFQKKFNGTEGLKWDTIEDFFLNRSMWCSLGLTRTHVNAWYHVCSKWFSDFIVLAMFIALYLPDRSNRAVRHIQIYFSHEK